MLVTNSAGGAIGIIVCGIDGISYVAPIAEFIKDIGEILPLSQEIMDAYNVTTLKQYQQDFTHPDSIVDAAENHLSKDVARLNKALDSHDFASVEELASKLEDDLL